MSRQPFVSYDWSICEKRPIRYTYSQKYRVHTCSDLVLFVQSRVTYVVQNDVSIRTCEARFNCDFRLEFFLHSDLTTGSIRLECLDSVYPRPRLTVLKYRDLMIS